MQISSGPHTRHLHNSRPKTRYAHLLSRCVRRLPATQNPAVVPPSVVAALSTPQPRAAAEVRCLRLFAEELRAGEPDSVEDLVIYAIVFEEALKVRASTFMKWSALLHRFSTSSDMRLLYARHSVRQFEIVCWPLVSFKAARSRFQGAKNCACQL